jgi:hypothetical protein
VTANPDLSGASTGCLIKPFPVAILNIFSVRLHLTGELNDHSRGSKSSQAALDTVDGSSENV